jgi:hypothetical protein
VPTNLVLEEPMTDRRGPSSRAMLGSLVLGTLGIGLLIWLANASDRLGQLTYLFIPVLIVGVAATLGAVLLLGASGLTMMTGPLRNGDEPGAPVSRPPH